MGRPLSPTQVIPRAGFLPQRKVMWLPQWKPCLVFLGPHGPRCEPGWERGWEEGTGTGWAGVSTPCSLHQGIHCPDVARCGHAHPVAEPAGTTGMTVIRSRGEDAVPVWAMLPFCWSHSLPRTGKAPAFPQHSRILGDLFLPKRLFFGFCYVKDNPLFQVSIGPTTFIKWLLCLRNDSHHYFSRRRFKLWRHNEFWCVFCAVSNCLISRSWSH